MIKELHNLICVMLSYEKFVGGRIVEYRIEKKFLDKKISFKIYKKDTFLAECYIYDDKRYLLGLLDRKLQTEEFETIIHTLENCLGLKSRIDNSGYYMMI